MSLFDFMELTLAKWNSHDGAAQKEKSSTNGDELMPQRPISVSDCPVNTKYKRNMLK